MSTCVRDRVVERWCERQGMQGLTGREREILGLMSAGLSNTAIAGRLSIMERTIESHITRIFTKLGLAPGQDENRRVMAVLMYLREAVL